MARCARHVLSPAAPADGAMLMPVGSALRSHEAGLARCSASASCEKPSSAASAAQTVSSDSAESGVCVRPVRFATATAPDGFRRKIGGVVSGRWQGELASSRCERKVRSHCEETPTVARAQGAQRAARRGAARRGQRAPEMCTMAASWTNRSKWPIDWNIASTRALLAMAGARGAEGAARTQPGRTDWNVSVAQPQ